MSGSATPVFHRSYEDIELKPNFFYQPNPWQQSTPRHKSSCPFSR
jgi:nitric-oxide synthase, bacterial